MTYTEAVLFATVEQCEDELRRSWGGISYAAVRGESSFRSLSQVRRLKDALWGAQQALCGLSPPARRAARRRSPDVAKR